MGLVATVWERQPQHSPVITERSAGQRPGVPEWERGCWRGSNQNVRLRPEHQAASPSPHPQQPPRLPAAPQGACAVVAISLWVHPCCPLTSCLALFLSYALCFVSCLGKPSKVMKTFSYEVCFFFSSCVPNPVGTDILCVV